MAVMRTMRLYLRELLRFETKHLLSFEYCVGTPEAELLMGKTGGSSVSLLRPSRLLLVCCKLCCCYCLDTIPCKRFKASEPERVFVPA